jgi:hypothetical protein
VEEIHRRTGKDAENTAEKERRRLK